MQRNLFTFLLLIAWISTACTPNQLPTQPTSPPQAETPVQPVATPTPEYGAGQQPAYPGPGDLITEPQPYPGIEQPPVEGYPGPEEPIGQPPIYSPGEASGFEPLPEDAQLERGEVYLQLESSDLLIMESYPVQAALILRGDLPDPCHKLRVGVSPPDSANQVLVEVYSVRATDAICTAVLEPFEARINLGSFAGGEFSVLVNGIEIGKING
jgi:hypothetical protein